MHYSMINRIISLVKFLMSMGISPKIFKELIAAHSVGRGQNAYNNKNYEQAYLILKPVADYDISDGYVGTAQMFVGLMYFFGNGVKQNTELSREYLNRAIQNDNDYAKNFISNLQANDDLFDSKRGG